MDLNLTKEQLVKSTSDLLQEIRELRNDTPQVLSTPAIFTCCDRDPDAPSSWIYDQSLGLSFLSFEQNHRILCEINEAYREYIKNDEGKNFRYDHRIFEIFSRLFRREPGHFKNDMTYELYETKDNIKSVTKNHIETIEGVIGNTMNTLQSSLPVHCFSFLGKEKNPDPVMDFRMYVFSNLGFYRDYHRIMTALDLSRLN